MSENQDIKRKEQGARFSILIERLGTNQVSLAQLVGTKQPSISQAIKGKTGIPKIWLYRMREKYRNINEDWLWTGDGEMLTVEQIEYDNKDLLAMEPMINYSNGKALKKEEIEKMLARMIYRIGELEDEQKRFREEMESMRRELVEYLRTKVK